MEPVHQPRSTEQATTLCERFAQRQAEIGAIQAKRDKDIAAINADADRALTDLIAERDLIGEKLQPWWAKSGHQLLQGKRKSVELGGCVLGTAKAKLKLGVPADLDAAVAKLQAERWGKKFLITTVSADRKAILKGVEDKTRGPVLKALGFAIDGGEDVFFVKRAEQEGTRG